MNEIVSALELLQSRLRTMAILLDAFKHEFGQEVEAMIKRSKRSKSKPSIRPESWKKMQEYKESIRDELRGAIGFSKAHGVELAACRKIAVALDSASDPIPFVFDADVELEQLIEKVLTPTKPDMVDEKMENAIRLFMETETPWSEIRVSVGCVNDSQKGFENNVRRYFVKTRGKNLSDVHKRERGLRPNRNK